MILENQILYHPWPNLPYEPFKPTAHLLHMLSQALGKLKLTTPFEPHWGNVALWLTARGLTTGLIPYQHAAFAVELDLIHHEVICTTSFAAEERFALTTTSVAHLVAQLFNALHQMGINIKINPKPQEVANPILFHDDKVTRTYDPELANAWWRILLSSYEVMQQYHALYTGHTPPIGLMWGTFDLRDARYTEDPIPVTAENAGYIRRNAMDSPQVEIGFWHGNDLYKRPAYFSFMFPAPPGIENIKVQPDTAKWNKALGEFILDYDVVRQATNPSATLLAFFQTTYLGAAKQAKWPTSLLGVGHPV